MSPDPPRNTDSDENPLHSEEVYFMPIGDSDDEFILNEDGPHDLDYSDPENMSEFSDDDSTQPSHTLQVVETTQAPGSEGQPRMMARYQLLIQMPPGETTDTSVQESGPSLPTAQTNQATSEDQNINEPAKEESMQDSKREINLTDGQVELIKNVMKGFTLPPSNIPRWAEEMDEKEWKETLVNVIQKKSCANGEDDKVEEASSSVHSKS